MKILRLLAVGFVAVFVEAWGLMILVGVLHGSFWPAIPTMGYDTAVKVDLALSLIVVIAVMFNQLGKFIEDIFD